MEKVFEKIGEWLVVIFAMVMRKCFPTWSVLYGTKKENKYARYFLPSVEKQRDIARLLSDESIEARVWDPETIYWLIVYDHRAVFLGELPAVMGEYLSCLTGSCCYSLLQKVEYPVPFLKAILPLLEDKRLEIMPHYKASCLKCAEEWVFMHNFQRFLLTNKVCLGNLLNHTHWAELREAIFQHSTSVDILVELLNLSPTKEEENRYNLVKKLDEAYVEGEMSDKQKERYILYLAEKEQDAERIQEDWQNVVAETNALIRQRYDSYQQK